MSGYLVALENRHLMGVEAARMGQNRRPPESAGFVESM